MPDLSGMDFDNMDPSNMPDLSSLFEQPGEPSVTAAATFFYESRRVDKDNAFFDPNKQGVVTWKER